MAMRMTGIVSGMDTESIIKELVTVRKTKVDDTKKVQTKLQWKQDAWKSLNTKLKNLQTKYVGAMRFSSAYAKKTTNVSNSSLLSVITGEDAVNGVQELSIDKMAKTGYLTGAKLEGTAGKLTALSKISDIAGNTLTGDSTINLTISGENKSIAVSATSTISDVISQLKDAGLNANFDANNQRLFISAKESGDVNDFTMTVSDINGAQALSTLGLNVNLSQDTKALADYQKYAAFYVSGDRTATLNNMRTILDSEADKSAQTRLKEYKSLKDSIKSSQEKIDKINEKYSSDPLKSSAEYQSEIDIKKESITNLTESMSSMTSAQKEIAQEQLDSLNEELNKLITKRDDAATLVNEQNNITGYNTAITGIEEYIDITETEEDGKTVYTATAATKLREEIEDAYFTRVEYAKGVIDDYDPLDTTSTGATKVTGQDSVITLNGAEFRSNTNTYEINGLTFTALAETQPGQNITVTTQNDTKGIYDMIKGFLKEYNEIINEMDRLYNADSAKGYEPLSNDEKEEMSDKDIEEWDKKIKDALLRRDENLSTVSQSLKEIMLSGANVNGKTMYLSDFGINTMSYFLAADNEKNAYHIDGDPDDSSTSGNADRLKGLISSDPDTVINFFSELSNTLYTKMNKLSTSVEGYRSFGSFYDDKKMTSDYNDYKEKIKEQEKKLSDYEDKWYKKFSAMETALAKMQSGANAVTSLLGGS